MGIVCLFFAFLREVENRPFPIVELTVGLFLTVILPIVTLLNARNSFKSTKRINELIAYEFDANVIQLTGESFNSTLSWDKIYDLTENKDWIFIWHNKHSASVVPKRDFSIENLSAFHVIVKNQKQLKCNQHH